MAVTSFLLGNVGYGDRLLIHYKTTFDSQYAINLIDDSRNNIILHFNPRYITDDAKNNNTLVLNNCIKGKWQEEVRYELKEDLRGEKNMTIDTMPHAFEITAADGKIYEFPVRLSVRTCTRMEITIGGSFRSVVHQKPVVNYYTAAEHYFTS